MKPSVRCSTCCCVFCSNSPILGAKLETLCSAHSDALHRKPFKQVKSFASRKQEVASIKSKFPNKLPVIVERYGKETTLPMLDKTKFLVPQELTMSQFVTILRNRMQLSSTMTLYVLVNNRSLVSLSRPLSEVYRECHDDDGFLYVTYASQEVFG
ncbi:microtubule-associated protein 1 light chain 3 alpha-like isoform X1 [Panulirus ornatus]|uniref:microtubule-associated protein 1 light chain 3 alpha-like isoform X1 n=1 Tax=Panulirus ornatus TaxID=150431 RepID=UPI003A84C605